MKPSAKAMFKADACALLFVIFTLLDTDFSYVFLVPYVWYGLVSVAWRFEAKKNC